MTQAVLKNEITDLTPTTGIDSVARQAVADTLSDVLADVFRLTVNAQGLHWNVEGPMFFSLHNLTETQYEALQDAQDTLAERIRALGLPAPQSVQAFIQRSGIDDLPADGELLGRIQRLISDYEIAAVRLTKAVEQAERNRDVKTADLLTDLIGQFDEFAWMLRATIAS